MSAQLLRKSPTWIALTFAMSMPFLLGARGCEPTSHEPGSCRVGDAVYANGDTGVPAMDGCNTCVCRDGEVAECTEIACPPDPMACLADGISYPDGATGIPMPGCAVNTCTCSAGELACTRVACPGPTECVADGVTYPSGTTGIPMPGCPVNTCICEDGTLACTEIACPTPSACTIFEDSYTDGWAPSSDHANTCVCEEGIVTSSCTEAEPGFGTIPVCGDRPVFMGDPTVVNALRIEDDALHMDVSFGGGCRDHHYFRLCQEEWLESSPVQVVLRLEQDGQDDHCRAWISLTDRFELSEVREAYRRLYRTEHDTVILRVADESVRYTF